MKKGVSKLLTLSTGHIRPETDAMLQGLTEDRWPFSGSRVAYGYFEYREGGEYQSTVGAARPSQLRMTHEPLLTSRSFRKTLNPDAGVSG